MPAQLLALTEGPSILLDKPILLFGRHPECDVQLNSRKVSRRHCCVAQVSDYLIVRDLGSTNGVRINGVRVVEGRLKHGDELMIGNFQYQVCGDLAGAEPLRAEPPLLRAEPVHPEPAASRGQWIRVEPAGLVPDSVTDEVLEACDEPMPLKEPAGPRVAQARPATPTSPPPFIIPDNLSLAPSPSGEVFPPPARTPNPT